MLVLLLVGPVFIYAALGMIWLWDRGWLVLTGASVLWLLCGVLFAILAARWTKSTRPVMPPLDWDAPQTFAPLDQQAWKIVQQEADQGESLVFEVLLTPDVYINSGLRLFRRLAKEYHPHAENPLDNVPLIELLTALELAAEDLAGLCRQFPGGDLIALAHWRKAVQVAGYLSKASNLYSYLSPLLNPVTGLARLGTQHLIVKPAWKSTQQNLLRWFYQAYINRLGMHFIELLSGRLAVGAVHYRRLTRRPAPLADATSELGPLVIAVAGASGSDKSRLIAAIQASCAQESPALKATIANLGLEPKVRDRMIDAKWIDAPDFPASIGAQSRRDRSAREAAIAVAVEGDLLILVVDGRRADHGAEAAFADAWERWFRDRPQRDAPPTLVVLTGVDRAEYGEGWDPPYDWTSGLGFRETRVRAELDALREILPPRFHEFVVVGLDATAPFGVAEQLVPALATLSIRAERIALLRRLQEISGRSKLGRLMSQIGEHGKWLVENIRSRRKTESPAAAKSHSA
jgi:predicted GTPase